MSALSDTSRWIEETRNVGTFVEYAPMTKEDLESFIMDESTLETTHADLMEKIHKQIRYKDEHLSNFTKKTSSGRTYMNIYAHSLSVMLPSSLPSKITYLSLVEKFLHCFDIKIKEKNLLWAFRINKGSKVNYADIIVFTRPFLKNPVRYERYNSDYWWNPARKKRGTPHAEGCVLLHKKGEFKKDSSGDFVERPVADISDTECQIFKYSGQEGFEKLFYDARLVLMDILQNMDVYSASRNSRYFRMLAYKKGESRFKHVKKLFINELIRDINSRFSFILDAFSYGGLAEDAGLFKELKRTVSKIKSKIYAAKFIYQGTTLSLDMNISYRSYKSNVASLRQAVCETIDGLTEKMDEYVHDMW